MSEHLVGLLLGTEEDWPGAFEALVSRLGPIRHDDEVHRFATERVTYEPFDLRYKPRYDIVIDRVRWWYDLPREWLKKVSLMDDVYLLNNPFTFQSMEKHSAYCAMMRLGLKVPDTWMIPHKVPPRNPRFEQMAARYNLPFDLRQIGERVGYPLYLKPFDGGQWVGVTRVRDGDDLQRRYDESGERLMHVQAAVEPMDIFVRSLSIGAETMVMHFEPDRPMHERYSVDHDFLDADTGWEVVTISRLVNAFFRWEFNSCETILRRGDVHPIDYANASPDVALTSLHYYFPWAIRTLLKWTVFCSVTRRRMRINQDTRTYFDVGDRDDLEYGEKLAEYRRLADAYFSVGAYEEFVATRLAHLDELTVEYFESEDFDRLLVDVVRDTFPAHEHEEMVARHRGLVGAWTRDQHALAGAHAAK